MIKFLKQQFCTAVRTAFFPVAGMLVLTSCMVTSKKDSRQGISGLEHADFLYEEMFVADSVSESPPFPLCGGFKSENLLNGDDWREIQGKQEKRKDNNNH